MISSEVTECRKGRQVGDTDVNLGMNSLVRWIVEEDNIQSDRIEDFKHFPRTISKKICKNWLRIAEVNKGDFEGLGVHYDVDK